MAQRSQRQTRHCVGATFLTLSLPVNHNPVNQPTPTDETPPTFNMKTIDDVYVYDQGPDHPDRWTVVYPWDGANCICACVGLSGHSTARLGSHLGTRAPSSAMPEALRRTVQRDLDEYNRQLQPSPVAPSPLPVAHLWGWCPDLDLRTAALQAAGYRVSHGICEICLARYFAADCATLLPSNSTV